MGVGFGDGSRRHPLGADHTVREDIADTSCDKGAQGSMEHHSMPRTPLYRMSRVDDRAVETLENIRKGPERHPGVPMAGYM
jgi:hypothetical protein